MLGSAVAHPCAIREVIAIAIDDRGYARARDIDDGRGAIGLTEIDAGLEAPGIALGERISGRPYADIQ